jgi:hypothetical protein
VKSSFIGRLLDGGVRMLRGQLPKEMRVRAAIPAVRLGASGLPLRDRETLDADGLSDFGLGQAGGEPKLLSDLGRGEGVLLHQGVNSPQRIGHRNLHGREPFPKTYMTPTIFGIETERVAVRDTDRLHVTPLPPLMAVPLLR